MRKEVTFWSKFAGYDAIPEAKDERQSKLILIWALCGCEKITTGRPCFAEISALCGSKIG